MVRLALVMIPLIALAGCQRENPAFCTNHPGEQGCPDAGDHGGSCKSNNDCTSTPDFPACDTTKNACVQCFGDAHSLCKDNTPRCEADMCVACVDDTQDCGQAGVCLATGACADSASIIYASSTSTKMTPCGTATDPCSLTGALMIAMAMPSKNVIKLENGVYAADAGFPVDANVTIDMRGATLHRNMAGPILDIKDNRNVTILGGTIENATGSNGDGILCNSNVMLTVNDTIIKTTEKSAINAGGGCNLTVMHASISNTSLRSGIFVAGILDNGDSITISRSSLISNRGGGIAVNSGIFLIIGNAVLNNGDGSNSSTGGIAISTSPNTSNHLDFNTIAHNLIQTGTKSGGVDCVAGTTVVGRYNIVWDNPNAAGVQISGSCKHAFSDIGPIPVVLANDGGNNMNTDPLLTNEQSDPHLRMGSPAIGYADPGADVSGLAAKDIDGEARVKRSGTGADIGADQYSPR